MEDYKRENDFENENEPSEEKEDAERLPIELPTDSLPFNTGSGGEKETPPQRSRKALRKAASAVAGILFCGTALLYMIVQTVESVDRLSSAGIGDLLEAEVFGPSQQETAPESETAPPQASAESTSPQEAPEAPSADDLPTHAIGYESLSNFDLLTDIYNETSYTPDLASLLSLRRGVGGLDGIYEKYGDDAPVVLIVHTHGTEAYTEEGAITYDESDSFRSEDITKNVVAIGDVMAKVLEHEGIRTLHIEEMFDKDSYRESYSKSYSAVSKYLKAFPSISYVIDVHRDSVFRDDMTNVATLAEVCGERSAQAMIVVGTDEGGADHKGWQDNLSLALNVEKNMEEISKSVPRKIYLRSAAFNQGLCPGALLFEIGSCGNTLKEAKRAAVVASLALSRAVSGKESGTDPSELISLAD